MSEKNQDQIITETHTDVRWLRENAEKLERRVATIEKLQWRLSGALVILLGIWEAIKDSVKNHIIH